jgi:hypothetical protein
MEGSGSKPPWKRLVRDNTCSANPAYTSSADRPYMQVKMTSSASYNAALTTTLSVGARPITDV